MKKTVLLLKPILHLELKKARSFSSFYQEDSGYTLIELLVVIIIIAILAGIAAPGWLGFVNQRRVNAANELVLRSLQEARNQARHNKLSYSVSFRENNGGLEIAVHQTQALRANGNGFDDVQPSNWKSLRDELGIQPGRVWLGTNLDGENRTSNNINNNFQGKKITFDHMGTLGGSPQITENQPINIVVAVPRNNNTPITPTQRCVQVTTLLGAMRTGRGAECSTNP